MSPLPLITVAWYERMDGWNAGGFDVVGINRLNLT